MFNRIALFVAAALVVGACSPAQETEEIPADEAIIEETQPEPMPIVDDTLVEPLDTLPVDTITPPATPQ
jgi:PBP1b-binding outer membrane lipoprotein LpoB